MHFYSKYAIILSIVVQRTVPGAKQNKRFFSTAAVICIFFALLFGAEYALVYAKMRGMMNEAESTVLKTAQSLNFAMNEIQRLSHILMINADVQLFVTQGPVEQGSSDIQVIIDAQRQLSYTKSVHPAIAALYVYSKKSDYLLEADNAFFDIDTMYSSLFEFEGLNSGQWRTRYLRPVYVNAWLGETGVALNSVNRRIIVYEQTLPLQNVSANTGKLIMLLKTTYFDSLTEPLFSLPESWMCIAGADGRPLFFRSHAENALQNDAENLIGSSAKQGENSMPAFTQKIAGRTYRIIVRPLNSTGTVLFSGIPVVPLFFTADALWFVFPAAVFALCTAALIAFLLRFRAPFAHSESRSQVLIEGKSAEASDKTSGSFERIAAVQDVSVSPAVREKDAATVKRILSYIEENYPKSFLNLSQMAQDFGITESFLYYFFRTRIHKSFAQYLEDFRLEKAHNIIETDIKEPVNSLAEKCGYANAQTFRRAFKKKYGLTPSEFKQKVFAESGEL